MVQPHNLSGGIWELPRFWSLKKVPSCLCFVKDKKTMPMSTQVVGYITY